MISLIFIVFSRFNRTQKNEHVSKYRTNLFVAEYAVIVLATFDL